MPATDADVFAALARGLQALGVRWYLFGAQAAILHGVVRFTEDIDVTVDLGGMPTSALVEALGREQFMPRIVNAGFIEKTRVVPFVHGPSATPVDVVLAGPGIEELFFEGAVEMDVEGVRVPVARAEDLVAMKILAGRAKDLEDVVAILATQGERFDAQRAQRLLELLEQALDQSDLLPLLATSLARARRARR